MRIFTFFSILLTSLLSVACRGVEILPTQEASHTKPAVFGDAKLNAGCTLALLPHDEAQGQVKLELGLTGDAEIEVLTLNKQPIDLPSTKKTPLKIEVLMNVPKKRETALAEARTKGGKVQTCSLVLEPGTEGTVALPEGRMGCSLELNPSGPVPAGTTVEATVKWTGGVRTVKLDDKNLDVDLVKASYAFNINTGDFAGRTITHVFDFADKDNNRHVCNLEIYVQAGGAVPSPLPSPSPGGSSPAPSPSPAPDGALACSVHLSAGSLAIEGDEANFEVNGTAGATSVAVQVIETFIGMRTITATRGATRATFKTVLFEDSKIEATVTRPAGTSVCTALNISPNRRSAHAFPLCRTRRLNATQHRIHIYGLASAYIRSPQNLFNLIASNRGSAQTTKVLTWTDSRPEIYVRIQNTSGQGWCQTF